MGLRVLCRGFYDGRIQQDSTVSEQLPMTCVQPKSPKPGCFAPYMPALHDEELM